VDLRIGETPVGLSEVYPAQLPDLFFGEELVVFGRYREQGTGRVVVTGRRNGRRERLVIPASFPRNEPQNDFIPRLWAARRIGELTRQIRLEGPSRALISQVRDLGLRYGILTEYTSYLVQEPLDLAGPDSPRRIEEDRLDRAASPASQTGAGAFERAEVSAKLSEAKTLAAADRVATDRLRSLSGGSTSSPSTRRVAGRLFIQRGQVWTDIRHTDRISITDIAAFSPAYFDLVRQLPEIARYLSAGAEVLIAGQRQSIRIAAAGIEAWSPGQLEDLVRNFRGT
jgi:Ca-activated chloride channel family protein